ncbi:MAG: hypothetical protein AAGD05_00620, partial [Bacteroidota bacterium]
PTKLRAVLSALEKIEATDALALMREGIQVMMLNRDGTVSEAQNEAFENMDERFLELRDLDELKYEYIKANKEAILAEMQTCL